MIYEQRIYTCIPGRLPALLKRFEEQTLKVWDKHGIKQAGFWTVLVGDGNNDLHYCWPGTRSPNARRYGTLFRPIRPGIRRATRARRTGPIIANIKSAFLRPTAFSAVKCSAGHAVPTPPWPSWSPAMTPKNAGPNACRCRRQGALRQ